GEYKQTRDGQINLQNNVEISNKEEKDIIMETRGIEKKCCNCNNILIDPNNNTLINNMDNNKYSRMYITVKCSKCDVNLCHKCQQTNLQQMPFISSIYCFKCEKNNNKRITYNCGIDCKCNSDIKKR